MKGARAVGEGILVGFHKNGSPIFLKYGGESFSRLDRQAVDEVEALIRKLDKFPLSLPVLAQATAIIVELTAVHLSGQRDQSPQGDVLRVKVGNQNYVIAVDRDRYVVHHTQCADISSSFYKSTEKLAWTITEYYFAPRHFFAALERCRREGRETALVPWTFLCEASSSLC